MKFNYKKIAATFAATAMIGFTFGIASAVSPSAQFTQGDTAIIYGSASANSDMVAATSIQTALGLTATSTGTGGAPTSGDFVRLNRESDRLNLRDSATTIFKETLTDEDLPELLEDGTFVDDQNDETDYEQKITLGTVFVLEYFRDNDLQDLPTYGMNFSSAQKLINYSLDFKTDPDSTVTSGDLVDFENSNIRFLGKNYFISDFDNSTLDITMLDSANSVTVKEGETQTVTVGSTTYEISISFISTSEVRFTVNGAGTNSLNEGQIFNLGDGSYLGVKDIRARDVAGTVGEVDVSVGSGKIELKQGSNMKINDNTINDITVEVLRGTASGGKEKLSRINLVWTLSDEAFITPETTLTMPGLESLTFSMGEFFRPSEEVTMVEASSSDRIVLKTEIKEGTVTVPLLFANASGEFIGLGESTGSRLASSNSINLRYNYTKGDRQAIASWNSSVSAESYMISFTSPVNESGTAKTTVRQRTPDGTDWEDVCSNIDQGSTCSLGSLTMTMTVIDSASVNKIINVTSNAGGKFNELYTKQGLKVFLPFESSAVSSAANPGSINLSANNTFSGPGHGFDTFNLIFEEEDRTENIAKGSRFNISIDENADNELHANTFEGEHKEYTPSADSNHVYAAIYSDLGTLLERTGAAADQRKVKIIYAGEEAYGEVFVASKVDSEGTTTDAVILKDNEVVGNAASRNWIVVGGSAVNTKAAQLLGATYPAYGDAWLSATGTQANSWLIRTFSHPSATGKVATLVAGYNAGDTTNAATYFTTQNPDIAAGQQYVGTTETSATSSVV